MQQHPKDISIADYTYVLPGEFIADYPLAERDDSRLLVYRTGVISETVYRQIADELPEGALLIFNNTRVVEARIVFQKATGGRIEIFCLEPLASEGGMAAAMSTPGRVRWKCLIGGASKWKPGQVLTKTIPVTADTGAGDAAAGDVAGPMVLEARYLGKLGDSFLIELSWEPAAMSFAGLLHHAGLIPLPPYIQRTPEAADVERYQTVYARHDGSVAAPTAGLHFTETIFDRLAARNIRRAFVTLHVGAGTFLPVKTATLEHHNMHTEFFAVGRETVLELLDALVSGRPIIPVGTTSARTIESLYWLGERLVADPGIATEALVVRQWDAYGEKEDGGKKDGGKEDGGKEDGEKGDSGFHGATIISPETALSALIERMKTEGLSQLVTSTQLLITPGYDWKIAHGLVTNFHQPESTLLLLVASLVGKGWKKIYAHALEHGFRFLSYGDGCLLLP